MSNPIKPFLYGLAGGAAVLASSILYNKIIEKKEEKKPEVSDDDDLDFNIFDTHQSDFDPEDAAEFFSDNSKTQPSPDIDMNALQQIRNDAFNSGYNAGLHVANSREYNRGYDEGVRYGYGIAQANAAKKIDDAYEEGRLDGLNANAPDLSDVECEPPLELDEVIKSGAINHVYKPEDQNDVKSDEIKDIQHAIAALVIENNKLANEDPIISNGVSCAIRAMLYRMELPHKSKKHSADQSAKSLSTVRDKLIELNCDYETIKKFISEHSDGLNKTLYEKSLEELKQIEHASENLRSGIFTRARDCIESFLKEAH